MGSCVNKKRARGARDEGRAPHRKAAGRNLPEGAHVGHYSEHLLCAATEKKCTNINMDIKKE